MYVAVAVAIVDCKDFENDNIHLFLLSLMNSRPFHFDFIADDNEFFGTSHRPIHTTTTTITDKNN